MSVWVKRKKDASFIKHFLVRSVALTKSCQAHNLSVMLFLLMCKRLGPGRRQRETLSLNWTPSFLIPLSYSVLYYWFCCVKIQVFMTGCDPTSRWPPLVQILLTETVWFVPEEQDNLPFFLSSLPKMYWDNEMVNQKEFSSFTLMTTDSFYQHCGWASKVSTELPLKSVPSQGDL